MSDSPTGSPFVPLAIVGMACRFPGADNLDEFWQMLVEGRQALGPIPPDRLDADTYYSEQRHIIGKTYSLLGGVVDHRPIDPAILPLEPSIAQQYDISHLTLCEVAAAAFRHAGYDPLNLPIRNTGVYVGNSSGGSELDYRQNQRDHAAALAKFLDHTESFAALSQADQATIRNELTAAIRQARGDESAASSPVPSRQLAPHVAAMMISEIFGLNGPAACLDAACASSFIALQSAAFALNSGTIDMAVVAGAAYRKLYEWVAIAQAGSMSTNGCCPFDARADGIVCADGYGVVIVKTLARAEQDGDNILSVVRGIGMASDGKGKGFWAPRKEGQSAAIRRAWSSPGEIAGLQYVEAHATSTQLGDATEVDSLTDALGEALPHRVPIASVKGNIGHTLEAAGIAGLIKTVLAMQHGIVPPAPRVEQPNPAIGWDEVPFFVPTEPLHWPESGQPWQRRAAVDSFGIGGLNMHVVIDQAPDSAAMPASAATSLPATDTSTADEPIAIIGHSCLLPAAHSPAELWTQMTTGADSLQPLPPERLAAGQREGQSLRGELLTGYEFDWKKFRIPPKQIESSDPLQFQLLDAAARALEDAGYAEKPYDRSRVGTVVGTIFRSDFILDHWFGVWAWDAARHLTRILQSRGVSSEQADALVASYVETIHATRPAARDETGSISRSTLASRITKQLDLGGGAYAVDAADASSTMALTDAIALLRSGRCDMVLCAAGQRSINAMMNDQSATGHGLPPGEGAVCFVLKRESLARADGDRILGLLSDCDMTIADSPSASLQLARQPNATSTEALPDQIGLRAEVCLPSPTRQDHCTGATHPATENCSGTAATHFPLTSDCGGANGLRLLLHGLLSLEHGQARADNESTAHHPLHATTDHGTTFANLSLLSHRGFHSPGMTAASSIQLEGGHGLAPLPVSAAPPQPASQIESPAPNPKGVPMSETITPDSGTSQPASTTAPAGASPAENTTSAEPAEFDATVPRRERMREEAIARRSQSAAQKTPAAASPTPPSSQPDSQPESAPSTAADPVTRRFVLGMVPATLPAGSPKLPTLTGPVLLLGDNPTAAALLTSLSSAGATVYQIPSGTEPATAVAQLDQIWQAAPVHHLLITTGRDEAAALDFDEPQTWEQRRQSGLMLPWHVAQRWFELIEDAGMLETASVVAVTSLGGDFGLAGHSTAIEGGGLAGLLKSMRLESRRQLSAKVIDAPGRDPAKLVAAEVLGEMAADSAEIEVGYVRGQRQVPRAVPQEAVSLPPREVPTGSTWVVTGGARGVTAEAALGLATKYNLKLHVLGSTALPEIPDAWKSLSPEQLAELRLSTMREAKAAGKNPLAEWNRTERAIEIATTLDRYHQAGAQVTYHCCDVTHPDALTTTLGLIRQTDGPITGIIHGAGAEVAGRFRKKKPENVARVLDIKMRATLALMKLTAQDRPRFFLGFGSTSGRFGGYLQTDYSLANELLAKTINAYRSQHPDCLATSFHWTAWADIGMAARGDGKLIIDRLDVARMPVAEGVAHLVDECGTRANHAEVLICDHPGGIHDDEPVMPSESAASKLSQWQPRVADAPIIETLQPIDDSTAVAHAVFDPTSDPFLLSHLDNGIPLFPAVMGIETCAEAAAIATGRAHLLELRDYKLINGLRMNERRPYRSQVQLTLDGTTAAARLTGDFYDKQGQLADPARQYQTCSLVLGDERPSLTAPEFPPIPAEWTPLIYSDSWENRTGNESGTVFYGPALQSLKGVAYAPDQTAQGWIVVPPIEELLGHRRGNAWMTHPAVLDAVLVGCDLFCTHLHQSDQFPHGIDRLQFGRPPRPGEVCRSWTVYRGRETRWFLFDFWLIGDDGAVIYACENCRFVDANYSINDAVKQSAKA